MKNIKNNLFYISIVGGFSALIYWFILIGKQLEQGRNVVVVTGNKSSWTEFTEGMIHNLEHPLALLLAQIIVIILMARLLGWLSKKIGQPAVIGEIIAGIILGPSLLGLFFPEFSAALFPVKSLSNLQFLSQIGLILFMFVIGMELDLKTLRNTAHDAVVISHASIIIPFALGLGLAYFIYPHFAPEKVPFASFGLFLGIAMSITAFPVLARIIQERGMHKTKLGTITLTCAAADDITAWCILAAVIAIVKAGSSVSALFIVGLVAIYVLIMIKIVRPFLKRIGDLHTSRENLSKPIVAIFFLTLVISAYTAEIIGIHALFGAFLAGAIMPDNIQFRNIFIEKVEDIALVLLLPLFFVFTGLRTQIGLLNDGNLWLITLLIIVVAVVGKFLGSALAAKFVKQNWRDSLTIGALMNTRGLMELVVLNIGYDLGVLNPQIFAMMVIMALTTTFMTGPAIDYINWWFKSDDNNPTLLSIPDNKFNILISFANPERGKTLLRLANSLTKGQNREGGVTLMHLSPSNELNHYNAEEYEKESFAPILQTSEALKQPITTLFKPSNDIENDIAKVANSGSYNLLLIGIGQSIFEGSLLGKILGFTTRFFNPDRLLNQAIGKENEYDNSPFDERTRQILTKSKVPVGILIDRGFNEINRIFVPVLDTNDAFLINYCQEISKNTAAKITIVDTAVALKNISLIPPQYFEFENDKTISSSFLLEQDIMIVSISSWKKLLSDKKDWLTHLPTSLILTDNRSKLVE